MICCGIKMQTIDTRTIEGMTRRRCRCKQCGARMYTLEVEEKEWRKTKAKAKRCRK